MNELKTRIFNKVIAITGMKNMRQLTIDSIEAATRDAHQSNWFKHDMQYLTVTPEATEICDGQLTIPTTTLPRIRRLHEVIVRASRITPPAPIAVFKTYGGFLSSQAKVKACLFPGYLLVESNAGIAQVVFAAFFHPDISDAGYSSWIAQEYSSVIIHDAAFRVLDEAGDNAAPTQKTLAIAALRHLNADAELMPPPQ